SLDVPTPPLPEQMSPSQAAEAAAEMSRVVDQYVRATGRGRQGLTSLVLRTLKAAYYSPRNVGHAGLASPRYCHFTSPIRRYPDLIVHRRLAELITTGPLVGDRLTQIESAHGMYASQSSEREKRAEDASREVMEWKKVIFMRDKVGNEYDGLIAGVAPFGIFVELEEIFVQGMIPVATIGDDFWRFDQRSHRFIGESSGRELRLGEKVRIEVHSIDEDRHQIEFRLVEIAGSPIARRER
ncbi:MAG TPA: RNB domain-containing ribonuclease, partial [Thermoanaerobaculia bacterium]